MRSLLIINCRESDKKAMETLMIRFWPFVDVFPEIIKNHWLGIFKREFLRHPIHALFLAGTVKKILIEIKEDEQNHKSFWLDTSLMLGLSENDLYGRQHFENPNARFRVSDITFKVGERIKIFGLPSSFISLLRLAAVEIVAESISHDLLVIFNDLGEKASKWFKVHAHHKEGTMSHEELVYRMAFAFDGKAPNKENTNKIIQEVVDLFIKAGEVPY
jgi:hypothetical protein